MEESTQPTHPTGPTDPVDAVLAEWERERPDLDLSAMGIFVRLVAVSKAIGPAVEDVFARHGIRQGEFDVLAALRRSGAPYTLHPSELSAALMMSRAGMTNRLDRLESAGMVERSLDSDDRRSFRVTLTATGLDTVNAALGDHAANLQRLVSGLGDAERRNLDLALRTLLHTVDTSPAHD